MPTVTKTLPRLHQLTGPAAGRLLELNPKVTVLGRSSDCDVVLRHPAVSKRHAAIERTPGGYLLKDLDSRAGTYVDDRRVVGPLPLREGTRIRICNHRFAFGLPPIEIRDDDSSTISHVSAVAIGAADASPPGAGPGERLHAVLKIGWALGSAPELGEFLDVALAALFDLMPQAERGSILLRDEACGDLTTGAARARDGICATPIVSRSILDRVIREGQPILWSDAASEDAGSPSLAGQGVHSLICAPLLDHRRIPMGVIQLDGRDAQAGFDPGDLELLVCVAGQVGAAVQGDRLHAAILREEAFDQELLWARRVHRALLKRRESSLAGYEFWDCYEPARHVGGDYYGYFPLPHPSDAPGAPAHRWAIAVGDVSGKGMSAALLMANLAAEVGPALADEGDPTRVVARLNRRLHATGVDAMFVTYLLAVIDSIDHRLAVVNAGHMEPLIRRADGGIEVIGPGAGGLPLAVEVGSDYQVVETMIGPGDTVVLYTDGVTDAMDPAGHCFGEGSLRRTISETRAGALTVGQAIIRSVRRHAAGTRQNDDITLLCFARDT